MSLDKLESQSVGHFCFHSYLLTPLLGPKWGLAEAVFPLRYQQLHDQPTQLPTGYSLHHLEVDTGSVAPVVGVLTSTFHNSELPRRRLVSIR